MRETAVDPRSVLYLSIGLFRRTLQYFGRARRRIRREQRRAVVVERPRRAVAILDGLTEQDGRPPVVLGLVRHRAIDRLTGGRASGDHHGGEQPCGHGGLRRRRPTAPT